MGMQIVLATNNKNKVREINDVLSPFGITVCSPKDLGLNVGEVEENGINYYENAVIKAQNVAKYTRLPVIADDSGLEVEAMDNKPGLHSARFADECGGHKNAINKILDFLKDKDNRNARFVCDIVLVNVEDKPVLFEGIAPGRIDVEPRGNNGFGYDPIFISADTNESYGLMPEEEKNKSSHRGRALEKFLSYLRLNGFIKE